ncbi:MAG: ribonuclease Y [Planctomycetota bacterium]|nr:ribonuclease Y [Planctomycetota bacterium]
MTSPDSLTTLAVIDPIGIGIGIGIGALLGAIAAWLFIAATTGKSIRTARAEGESIVEKARSEAQSEARRIESESERKIDERRESAERETASMLAEAKEAQTRATKREETLDQKLDQITRREERLEKKETRLDDLVGEREAAVAEARTTSEDLKERLARVSDLSREEAREILLEETRQEAQHEAAKIEQEVIEVAEEKARERSREITLMAIQRYASENVSDSTVRSVKIPSDDMKGRIIGREGRNIRAIEKATGADILVDDTPGVISVSCFDRVRQAIAAESLQKLVADGRVHPSRVEEIVAQTKRDIEERIKQSGQEAIVEANLRGVHPKVAEAMGKLSFRTSYGQNVLRHSIEVAFLSQMIADQLGLDGQVARRCGFLHDIGKAMDHEMEGGHPAIGMEFARKFGEKSEAVLNAIGGHHSDIPSTTPYTPIVMAADAISGARPGARRESMEMYIKRLEQLEGIATDQKFVDEAHAIQAGREVRVILNASKADDATAHKIARDIAKRVEEEMTFPGEIKVTVLREVRAEAVAR